jgi:hypothetical protein
MTSLGNPFPFLFFFVCFDERPAKPKVKPKDACHKHHKKNRIKAQHRECRREEVILRGP